MKVVQEFKEFALRGNVIDMAVGIIIGSAFGTIVQSLVKDVIMPPVGVLVGGIDFSSIRIVLREGVADAEPVAINVGVFLNNVIFSDEVPLLWAEQRGLLPNAGRKPRQQVRV